MYIMGKREFQVATHHVNVFTTPVKRAKMIAKAKKDKSQIVFWEERLRSLSH